MPDDKELAEAIKNAREPGGLKSMFNTLEVSFSEVDLDDYNIVTPLGINKDDPEEMYVSCVSIDDDNGAVKSEIHSVNMYRLKTADNLYYSGFFSESAIKNREQALPNEALNLLRETASHLTRHDMNVSYEFQQDLPENQDGEAVARPEDLPDLKAELVRLQDDVHYVMYKTEEQNGKADPESVELYGKIGRMTGMIETAPYADSVYHKIIGDIKASNDLTEFQKGDRFQDMGYISVAGVSGGLKPR